MPHRAGAQRGEAHQAARHRQPLPQRGRPLTAERPLLPRGHRGRLVQVGGEHVAGHAVDRGHRAERLEGIEDVLQVVICAAPHTGLGQRGQGVHVEVGPDRIPHRLREPGHRNWLLHAVDRGQHIGHDHVIEHLHRRGRLVGPDRPADGVADAERRFERPLPERFGVSEHRPRLGDRNQPGPLSARQAGFLRPGHDQVQAGQLGGAAESQALIAGAEQRSWPVTLLSPAAACSSSGAGSRTGSWANFRSS